jgi:hypothetical protein
MSRFAQIGRATSKQVWEFFLFLLFALYVALSFGFGLRGALVAFVAAAVFSRFAEPWINRRYPRSELSEIGTIEMEMTAWTVPGHPIKFFFGAFILFLILWLVLLCFEVVTVVESHFQGVREESDLALFLAQAILFAGCAASMYTTYRNRWRRLLVTDHGVFQVVDTKHPWPDDRPLDEPNSPLRAARIYSWDQVARFHWSRQSGEHVLHLNVHQRGFGVPQLASFTLRALPEEDRQKLDQLLRTHISGTVPQEPGRASTTSAAV